MKKSKSKTKEELIDFFNKNHRAPTQSEDRLLQRLMYRLIKGGDKEIISLYEEYRENTKEYISARRTAGQKRRYEDTSERISRIKKKHEETGIWPSWRENSTDYKWIYDNRSKSEEISELWEKIRKQEKMPKTPTGFETKTVSELTLSEISSFLKLIGNKTVSQLIKEPEKPIEPEKVDVSKIETTLPEDTIRTIINPEKEVVVANQKWKKAMELLEYIFADDSLKRHFAYEMLLESPIFTREVALFVMNNPNKTFYHKDKIVERMIGFIPADRYFLSNPANIQDLVANCF